MVYNQPNMGKYNIEGKPMIASDLQKNDWILVFSRARGPSMDMFISHTGATFFATVDHPAQITKQRGNCRVMVTNVTEGRRDVSIAGNTRVTLVHREEPEIRD